MKSLYLMQLVPEPCMSNLGRIKRYRLFSDALRCMHFYAHYVEVHFAQNILYVDQNCPKEYMHYYRKCIFTRDAETRSRSRNRSESLFPESFYIFFKTISIKRKYFKNVFIKKALVLCP